jgi:hypothetical protein
VIKIHNCSKHFADFSYMPDTESQSILKRKLFTHPWQIMLKVVLYGSEAWSVILREEHRGVWEQGVEENIRA